jgi:hypothetical protein
VLSGALTDTAADDSLSFSRDVLPILSENCFPCHGPDEEQRQAELRLDDEAEAIDMLNRPAGHDSELLRRIETDNADEIMPPGDSTHALTSEQKTTIRRWILSGSGWSRHWSFETLSVPAVPEREFPDIPKHNQIAHLVQATLEGSGLTPSPAADRHTLLRRVTLDLTGLPPTPAEQRAFIDDTSLEAYEHVVDRLLGSTAWGERMAWDWLNAARYADSNGYQGDRDRTMWPWRDWVVDAFNDNMRFNDFTVWQLAGDLLPHATFEQQLATAFCRHHMINGEGGRIPEENRVDYVMDMTETMGTVWLGLTLNCCRCHDHKFDPLGQQDYYQFYAFFNQTPVDGAGGDPQTAPVLAAPTQEDRQRLAAIESAVNEASDRIRHRENILKAGQPDWETATKVRLQRQTESQKQESSRNSGDPDRVSGSVKTTAEATALHDQDQLLDGLQTDPGNRSHEQNERLRTAFLMTDSAYSLLIERHHQLTEERKGIRKRTPQVMVMEDRSETRTTFVLTRGLYNDPTDRQAVAATPTSLPAGRTNGPMNRLDLATWLVSEDNPLTARVTVNRYWQQIFGMGLVKTAEDFGVQGEYPLQKELLDWLAADFRENGWDLKRLLRMIVTSHTYRQSSTMRRVTGSDNQQTSEREIDPDNRLLARSPRFRWPSFVLRDQALAAGGLLNFQVGGPPIHTYQPPGVWAEQTFGRKQHSRSEGNAIYRRSLYVFWRRIVAPTVFFDNVSRQTCTVRMSRTNTPLHSLLTLNETTYVESARALAQQLLEEQSTDDAASLNRAFRRIVCRDVTPDESLVFLRGLERSRIEYTADAESAVALLSVGDSRRNAALDPAEHAAWTAVCLAILNLDEALTRE